MVGRGEGDIKYREVYKDPPDAREMEPFRMCYRMKGLQPATSYLFRIRGFNGFGPGEYTYCTFTTRPARPDTPRVMNVTSHSVTLRWVFSEEFRRVSDESCGGCTGDGDICFQLFLAVLFSILSYVNRVFIVGRE